MPTALATARTTRCSTPPGPRCLLAAGHDVGKTHRGVLNRLQRPTLVKDGPMSKEAGRLLKHAEAFRYVADYSDNAVDLTDASELVRQAETFVATVRSMLAHSEPGTGGGIPAGRTRPRSTRC